MTRPRGAGPRTGLPVVAAMLGIWLTTGCEDTPHDEAAYCTRPDHGHYQVVDDDECDTDDRDGHYIIVVSHPSGTYRVGETLPRKVVKDSTRIRANDTAARSRASIPKTGIRNGSVVRGGFGGHGGGKGAGG